LRTVNENGFDDTGRNILNLNSHVNKDKDVQMMDYRKYKKLQELKEKNEILKDMKTIDVINAIDTHQVLKNDVPTVYTQTQQNHT